MSPRSDEAPGSERGTVITVFRGGCEVVKDDHVRELHLGGLQARRGFSLAVGDDVRFDAETGRLIEIEPRRTSLERLRPRDRKRAAGRTQVIAANMDQVAIVAAVTEPPFVPGLVDRFLLAASAGGLRALLVANKIDLLEGERLPPQVEAYRAVVPVVAVSALRAQGLGPLRERLAGVRTVLAGHSGVGKSSLLNALDPELRLDTGDLRPRDGKGRHTTSQATWYRLEGRTIVVDTPGVREIATGSVDLSLLSEVYPDLERYASECRFRDCGHEQEPDCAVREAAAEGHLPLERLEGFRKLRREVEGR